MWLNCWPKGLLTALIQRLSCLCSECITWQSTTCSCLHWNNNKADKLILHVKYIEAPMFPFIIYKKTKNNARTKTPWWRHQMETFSALLALCAGNSPVTGEFLAQRPVTRSFDVFFDLRLNKLLNKQSWGWWSGTQWRSLWRHCNAL